MSGETRTDISGWSVDTLFAHLNTILHERDVRYEQRFQSQETALRMVDTATRDQFKGRDLAFDVHVHEKNEMIRTLDHAVQEKFVAQEKSVAFALNASEKAVNVAENTAEKWRQNANEWRGAMDDRERQFVIQGSFDQAMTSLQAQLVDIKERIDKADALHTLTTRVTQAESKGQGMQAMYGWIIGAIGVTATLMSLLQYIK